MKSLIIKHGCCFTKPQLLQCYVVQHGVLTIYLKMTPELKCLAFISHRISNLCCFGKSSVFCIWKSPLYLSMKT